MMKAGEIADRIATSVRLSYVPGDPNSRETHFSNLDKELIADALRAFDPGSAPRYWEGRWRDEKASHEGLQKALEEVRRELWVDFCLAAGRTDVDQTKFDQKPVIRIINVALGPNAIFRPPNG